MMAQQSSFTHAPLRIFSKVICFLILALIFLGGLVKSTESGLSVPDWPTTYGRFMFSFPLDQMAGGIKYEHTHRMLASIVGLLSFIFWFLLQRTKAPVFIKRLALYNCLVVVLQGILGGLTVKYFLPVWLSSFHGTLAHIYLVIAILIAYALSQERAKRLNAEEADSGAKIIKGAYVLLGMVFIQLIIGNVMRHTQSGLAVPDFPTMGGSIIPTFNKQMLANINAWRFEHNLDPVTMGQVHIHMLHRIWAFLIVAKLFYLNHVAYRDCLNRPMVMKTVFWINFAILLQMILGISTILTGKEVYTTTFHVTVGAFVLGLTALLILRAAPTTLRKLGEVLAKR